jgi:ABC-2 type transport system permease protein
MGRLPRILSDSYVTLKSIFRYRGVLFWVIIFPILFYLLMVGIWGTPSANPINVGIVDRDNGVRLENGTNVNLGKILEEIMNNSKIFKIKYFNNSDSLKDAIKRGEINAGILIPENFTSSIFSMEKPTITVYYMGGQYGEYYKGYISGFLEGFSDNIRERFINEGEKYAVENAPENIKPFIVKWFEFVKKPINITYKPHAPEMLATKEGVRAFYAIGMIAVEVLFIGLSTGTTSLIEMKKDKTLQIVLSSPMRSWELLTSQTLSSLIAIGISAVSIFLVSLPLGAKYNISLSVALTLVLLLTAGAIFTIGLGLLLATLAKTEEAAMAIVNGLAFPIMFIGGLVIPDFILPEYLRAFAKYYPLSRSINAIRKMLIYNTTPGEALAYALPALAATIITFIIGALIFNRLIAEAVES